MKHFHDETMDILDSFIEASDTLDDDEVRAGLQRFEKSIDAMTAERNARLVREVRDELGKHGVATGDYGPLNRFCEMI